MMRQFMIPTVWAVLLLTPAIRAAAQAPATSACTGRECVVQKWQTLHRHAIEQLERGARSPDGRPPQITGAVEARDAATRQASIIAAVDAVEPDDSTAAATLRRLAGAIKTNPEGTEAGLVIAPFALAGSKVLPGLEVTFAALEDDFTRAGLSYTWDGSPKLADIWEEPAACPVTDKELATLEEPHDFYLNACSRVVAHVPEAIPATDGLSNEDRDAYDKHIHQARLACGLSTAPLRDDSNVVTLTEALFLVRRAIETTNHIAAQAPAVIPAEVATFAKALGEEGGDLGTWVQPSPTACYSDEDVRGYFRQLYWKNRTSKFALGTSFDLFPRKWGFNPDASEPPVDADPDLPNGDVKSGEARFDFSTAKSGTEWSFGGGFGRSRDKLGDELRGYIPLSLSFAHAVSLLPKKQPLRTANGGLNVVDGEIPPRLVFGVSAAVQIAVNKRESQETRWNSVKIQPHVDFLVTETLSFRLGIPFNGEIVVREAKDAVAETPTTPAKAAVTEMRDLQWKVPVAIVAVLKL